MTTMTEVLAEVTRLMGLASEPKHEPAHSRDKKLRFANILRGKKWRFQCPP